MVLHESERWRGRSTIDFLQCRGLSVEDGVEDWKITIKIWEWWDYELYIRVPWSSAREHHISFRNEVLLISQSWSSAFEISSYTSWTRVTSNRWWMLLIELLGEINPLRFPGNLISVHSLRCNRYISVWNVKDRCTQEKKIDRSSCFLGKICFERIPLIIRS